MKIHCFQHIAFETPGSILAWAQIHQYSINYTLFYENPPVFPLINDIDFLLVLGGCMNVDEEAIYPWLREEKEFIQQAVSAGKKVLGICLGSQLIAHALGSKVYPQAEKEIGFFPVQFAKEAIQHPFFNHFKNPYMVFHWHGDTFNLPAGAALIASSDNCKNQAYLIGNNVLGLQFHIEMNEIVIKEMISHDADELVEMGSYIQSKEVIKNGYQYLAQNKNDLFRLLDKFIA
jgi:GMP synthase-like glutamine amidotransferase